MFHLAKKYLCGTGIVLLGLFMISPLYAASHTAPANRVYVGVSGGINTLSNLSYSTGLAESSIDVKSRYGFNGQFAVGYLWHPFRIEAAYLYQHNQVDEIAQANTRFSNPSGRMTVQGPFLNLYYDWYQANPNIVPYLGVGLGLAHVSGHATSDTLNDVASVSNNSLALQAMLGVHYALTCHWALQMDYRFLHVNRVEFTGRSLVNPTTQFDGRRDHLNSHSANVGLAYYF